MVEARHYYKRPSWNCLACGEPWPCAVRRAAFLAKYSGRDDHMRLRGILGALVHDARRDLALTREQLDARFINWTLEPTDLVAVPESHQPISGR